ncbi:MAG: NUDIX domain-containing protein [Caldilineaceae bacterium]
MPRAAALLIQNDRIALIKRERQGLLYYVFPGGQVEEGETLEQATVREVAEELGLVVTVGPLLAVVTRGDLKQYYFLAEASGGLFGAGTGPELQDTYPPENGAYTPVWVPLADLPDLPARPSCVADLVVTASRQGWPGAIIYLQEEPSGSVMTTSINVSGLIPEAQAIAERAATIYRKHTAPWFIGLVAHGSAVKGGYIANCSDIDFQLYLADEAFTAAGELPLALGMAIHQELAQIDPAPFRYIQCYALTRRLRSGWIGPIPGAYHLLAGRIPVPLATADELREAAQKDLAALQPDPINLLSHGGGRLERHVRLHCTKVWPVLYQVAALQQDDPIRVWNLPKPAVIGLLPAASELGQAIHAYDQAVRTYYPTERSVADGLKVLETGMAFLQAAKRWWMQWVVVQ